MGPTCARIGLQVGSKLGQCFFINISYLAPYSNAMKPSLCSVNLRTNMVREAHFPFPVRLRGRS